MAPRGRARGFNPPREEEMARPSRPATYIKAPSRLDIMNRHLASDIVCRRDGPSMPAALPLEPAGWSFILHTYSWCWGGGEG